MPSDQNNAEPSLLRILDANQNRAREALRVIEEYLRMARDDAHLASVCKELRHRLQSALNDVEAPAWVSCRDTLGDVGVGITCTSEASRSSLESVVAAAFSRLQQSLRSLEEYGKIVSPPFGAEVEQLRYATYTLEKAVAVGGKAATRLDDCRLYVLLDGRDDQEEYADYAERLVAAGADALQLRHKRADDRTLLARARRLREITSGSKTLCIVNDRPDIALLAHADGVHVGQEELPVADVRRLVGGTMLIGVSTHNLEQARRAVLAGADYLGVGPVFTSQTKQFDQLAGLEFVREVAEQIRLPAFAIGGIELGNVDQIVAHGMRRIAVSAAIHSAADPAAAVAEFRRRLEA